VQEADTMSLSIGYRQARASLSIIIVCPLRQRIREARVEGDPRVGGRCFISSGDTTQLQLCQILITFSLKTIFIRSSPAILQP
jgi:hypothetical protein